MPKITVKSPAQFQVERAKAPPAVAPEAKPIETPGAATEAGVTPALAPAPSQRAVQEQYKQQWQAVKAERPLWKQLMSTGRDATKEEREATRTQYEAALSEWQQKYSVFTDTKVKEVPMTPGYYKVDSYGTIKQRLPSGELITVHRQQAYFGLGGGSSGAALLAEARERAAESGKTLAYEMEQIGMAKAATAGGREAAAEEPKPEIVKLSELPKVSLKEEYPAGGAPFEAYEEAAIAKVVEQTVKEGKIPIQGVDQYGEATIVKLTPEQAQQYSKASEATGQEQFDIAVELGIIPEGSTFVPEVTYLVWPERWAKTEEEPIPKPKEIKGWGYVPPETPELRALRIEQEKKYIKLKDRDGKDTWIPIESIKDDKGEIITLGWNDWPEEYQSIALRENVDAAILAQQTDYDKFTTDLKEFWVEPSEYDPDGGYDVSGFIRKYPEHEQLADELFPEGIVAEAKKFNKEMETLAKAETLAKEVTWVNTVPLSDGSPAYSVYLSSAERNKLKGADFDAFVKDLPALVLAVDPKWQELKNRPDTDPEKIAYKEKWAQKVTDTAMFAATVATPYTMGGIGWIGSTTIKSIMQLALRVPGVTATGIGLKAAVSAGLTFNPIVKIAVHLAKLVNLAPAIYTTSRAVDEMQATRLQADWQKFEQLSIADKDKWADKAGYPADFNKLTDEQKAVVLLNYAPPPEIGYEKGQRLIAENLDKMHEYASKGSEWLQERAPAPVAKPVMFVGGAVAGVIEGMGYVASIPMLGAMLGAGVIRGTAPALAKDIATGMVEFFTKVLPEAIAVNPALAAGRITGLFVLSPAAALKLGKGGLARLSPRYIPERAIAVEANTIRIFWEKLPDFKKLTKAEKLKFTEQLEAQLLSGKRVATIKLGNGQAKIEIRNVPYQQIVGDSLFNFSDTPLVSGKTKVYATPQAAIRFGLMEAGGKRIKTPVLNEIRVPKGFKPNMEKLLRKGEAELESVFGKDVKYEPIPGWTGKGLSASVQLGAYPIRRFTIAGAPVKSLTPAILAKIRVAAAKEALTDTFLGWHGRMQALKQMFSKNPKVARAEKAIRQLKSETPETTGKYGEITNIREPVPHPSGKGTIKPRVTAVVRNSKGEIMLVKDVTEQSFSLPGGQIDVKWKPGQLGFKRLPDGRHVLTYEGAAHGQVKSETGIGLAKTRFLDIYMGKVNEYAQSGSRIYEALAKTDRFKLKKSEIKDALWWDGKSKITVYPATFDILKGLSKKYNLDMSKVKVDKSVSLLNKARDKAVTNRLAEGKPIKEATISQLNKAEIASLKRQLADAAVGTQPSLADWITSEGDLANLAELLHGRRQAVRYILSDKAKAIDKSLGKADKQRLLETRKPKNATERQWLEIQEARDALKRLEDTYNEHGYDIYGSDRAEFYANRYTHYLNSLLRVASRTRLEALRESPPRITELAREYRTSLARENYPAITRQEYKTYPELHRLRITPYPETRRVIPELRIRPEPTPTPRPEPIPTPRPEPIPTPRPRPPRPPRPPVPPLGKAKAVAEKRKEFAAAVTWRQGALGKPAKALWYAVKAPYKGREDVGIFIGEPPPDAQIVKGGAKSAFKSIQAISGIPPSKLQIDLGFQDIIISKPKKRPGEPGAIQFKQDIGQRTSGDIIIGKRGKITPRVTKGTVEEPLVVPNLGSQKMPKEIALKIGSYSAKVGSDGKLKVKVRRL